MSASSCVLRDGLERGEFVGQRVGPLGDIARAEEHDDIASLGEAVIYQGGAHSDLFALREQLAPLDLLISAEDLAATLAEAIGRPVWKVAGARDHWSWRAEGEVSKWHPGTRIFRLDPEQPSDAIEALRSALAQEAGFTI